jgi:hypothetical protein
MHYGEVILCNSIQEFLFYDLTVFPLPHHLHLLLLPHLLDALLLHLQEDLLHVLVIEIRVEVVGCVTSEGSLQSFTLCLLLLTHLGRDLVTGDFFHDVLRQHITHQLITHRTLLFELIRKFKFNFPIKQNNPIKFLYNKAYA